MNDACREALQPLCGMRLSAIGAAADMLWVHFGELTTVPTRSGGMKKVGEWALHLQCPWRFVRGGAIVLASSDFYYDAETGEHHDQDSDRDSVYARHEKLLSELVDGQKTTVLRIESIEAGAFEIRFAEDLKLSIMPVHSTSGPKMESWRFFQPDRDGPHFVFEEEGEPGGRPNAAEPPPESGRQ